MTDAAIEILFRNIVFILSEYLSFPFFKFSFFSFFSKCLRNYCIEDEILHINVI